MSITRNIGIDFGTSTTVIQVKDYENGIPKEPTLPPRSLVFDGQTTAPTIVFIREEVSDPNNKKVICGVEAENQNVNGAIYRNFKMDLLSGEQDKFDFSLALTRAYFQWVRQVYNNQYAFLGKCDEEITYLSYPTKWPAQVIEAMKEIAIQAGFKNVTLIDEPTAAIHNVMLQELEYFQQRNIIKKREPLNIMLIDMGAGTTDFVICKYIPDNTDIHDRIIPLATWPERNYGYSFGGREFDEIICDMIGDYLKKCGLNYSEKEKMRYLPDCKAWKEGNLSPALKKGEVIINPPSFILMITNLLGVEKPEFDSIDRSHFETKISAKLDEFAQLVSDCIQKAATARHDFTGADDIDLVILTGGHSQWYFVPEMLLGKLNSSHGKRAVIPKLLSDPKRLIQLERPQETVASGLAFQGMNVVIKEVAQNSVWIQFTVGVTEFAPKLLIKKGTILPYVCNDIIVIEDENIEEYVLTANDLDFKIGIAYKLLIGETNIDSARESKKEVFLSPNPSAKLKFRMSQLSSIIHDDELTKMKDKATIALKISVNPEQIIQVQGLIILEKSGEYEFSHQETIR